MTVNICGIPHLIVKKPDNFNVDSNLGMIDYLRAEISINENLKGAIEKDTICHEMVHGMLVHI